MRKCRGLLLRSLKGGKKSLWRLIEENEYDLKTFLMTLSLLIETGEVGFDEQDRGFYLKGDFPYPLMDFRCPHCRGRGYWEKPFVETLKEFERLTRNRPLPVAEYDQGIIAPEDVAAKAGFMYQRGDLADKEVLILGDDDLFSLFLSLTRLPRRVVAVDIDERILHFLNELSIQENLNIETVRQDLSQGLPELGRFDTFVTEPPESLHGIKVFLGVGMEALGGEGSAGYCGLTRLESSWAKWRIIEGFVLQKGFAITDILRDFSLYPEGESEWENLYQAYRMMQEVKLDVGPPDLSWYKSCLIRIEKVRPIEEESQDLYMDQETLVTPKPFR